MDFKRGRAADAPIIIRQIFDILKQINKEHNTTIFLVEQNANLALQIADRRYVIENGRIVMKDEAQALLENGDLKKAYVGGQSLYSS